MSSLNTKVPARYLPPSAQGKEDSTAAAAVNPFALFPTSDQQVVPVPESHQFTKITFLPLLLKSLSLAMLEWPLFRSSITPNVEEKVKPTLTVRSGTDIAVALSTPTGLYTPTLTGVNMSSVYDIQSKLKHLQFLGPCHL